MIDVVMLTQGDGATVVSVESTDVLGNKRASYRDYIELWRHLVDPTKLKVSSDNVHRCNLPLHTCMYVTHSKCWMFNCTSYLYRSSTVCFKSLG